MPQNSVCLRGRASAVRVQLQRHVHCTVLCMYMRNNHTTLHVHDHVACVQCVTGMHMMREHVHGRAVGRRARAIFSYYPWSGDWTVLFIISGAGYGGIWGMGRRWCRTRGCRIWQD